MTRVILLRHCQSEGNLEGYFQGRIDTGITDTGKKQIELVAQRLKDEKIDMIISSPLKRAYLTAQGVNKYHNVPLLIDDNITEIDAGCLSGKYIKDISEQYPEDMYYWWNEPYKFNPHNGESMKDVFKRVYKALNDIIIKNSGKTVCIVSHGCAIRCMMCHAHHTPLEEINNISWGTNTAVNIIECNSLDNDVKIITEFDSEHLSSLNNCDTWVTK